MENGHGTLWRTSVNRGIRQAWAISQSPSQAAQNKFFSSLHGGWGEDCASSLNDEWSRCLEINDSTRVYVTWISLQPESTGDSSAGRNMRLAVNRTGKWLRYIGTHTHGCTHTHGRAHTHTHSHARTDVETRDINTRFEAALKAKELDTLTESVSRDKTRNAVPHFCCFVWNRCLDQMNATQMSVWSWGNVRRYWLWGAQ